MQAIATLPSAGGTDVLLSTVKVGSRIMSCRRQ